MKIPFLDWLHEHEAAAEGLGGAEKENTNRRKKLHAVAWGAKAQYST
jgi:hypothetical protein